MKKVLDLVDKYIPSYARLPLLLVVGVNFCAYFFSRVIASGKHHYYIDTVLDHKIPFLPWMVYLYLGCYIFWMINYVLVAHLGKKHAIRFYSSEIFAKLICFLFYILLPTTMVRAQLNGNGMTQKIMTWLYQADAADNLFPSIHCLVSWFCYIGIRGKKEIPKSYRIFSLIIAILICISTVTVKQHVLADIAGGILLAEFSYWIFGKVTNKIWNAKI